MEPNFSPPVARPLSLTADELLDALLNLAPERRAQILDSCGARDADARYLIAGFDPFKVVEARRGQALSRARDENGDGSNVIQVESSSVLSILDEHLARYRVPAPQQTLKQWLSVPAVGACIATFSYDLGRNFERLRSRAPRRETDEPDAVLAFYDMLVFHDYASGETAIVSVGGPRRVEETAQALSDSLSDAHRAASLSGTVRGERIISSAPPRSGTAFQEFSTYNEIVSSNFTRQEYIATVERIKEHIRAGDIYQANLTQQLTRALPPGTRAEDIFRRLRRDHPASFAAFLRRSADTVVSASPERFLRVTLEDDEGQGGRRVEAWPIKGTRPRGRDAAEDARLRADLALSAKDRAENVMIVDLLRNDLGRVCRYGSVEVAELCAVQEHPTLFHLVSKVRGSLRDGVTAGELLRAAFPCGSITGAPKIRA
ncbi:MAG: anthranilate synthase component I family protein, partial [Pyrinomonadaceae bacterium]